MAYSVVRRAFRDKYGMHETGSIVDPVNVKNYKYRVQDGHIVEVDEHNQKQWRQYFKDRIGVALPTPEEHKAAKKPATPKAAEAPAAKAKAPVAKPKAST